MFIDSIVRNMAPLIQNRILELLQGVAGENNLKTHEIQARLRVLQGKVMIKAYHDGKVIRDILFDDITGNVGDLVEDYIKNIFKKDAEKYQTNIAEVSYMLSKDSCSDTIIVHPYINKQYQSAIGLKKLLSNT